MPQRLAEWAGGIHPEQTCPDKKMENRNQSQGIVDDGHRLNNPARSDNQRLVISPIAIQTAMAFVAWTHRHRVLPAAAEFAIGVQTDDGTLVGAVLVGWPVARAFDDGYTAEVTRLSTDGTPNACSMLLGAAWRAAHAMGYRRLITHTCADEPDISLLAAGLTATAGVACTCWEITSSSAEGGGA